MNPQSQLIIDNAAALDTTLTQNQQTIDSLNGQLQACTDQSLLDKAAIKSLNDKLAAVTADDTSLADKILTTQGQLARVIQLAKPNVALNLHRLPSTQDPNARPLMQWFQPGNAGNTGGASGAKHGTWTMTQNADGSTEFAIAPAMPWDNYFWALNLHQGAIAFNRCVQVTEFEIPDEALAVAMAVETNWEHSNAGFRYNGGLQCLFGTDKDKLTGLPVSNQFRYYDISGGGWFYTGIPLDRKMFGTGKRIQLVSEFAESSGGMQNISLAVNGVVHAVNKFTKGLATTWGPYVQQGYQMDCLQSAAPFKTKVWNMETYWF